MTARIGPGGPGGPVFGYHGNGLLSFLYGDFYFAVIDDNPIVTSTSYDWVVTDLGMSAPAPSTFLSKRPCRMNRINLTKKKLDSEEIRGAA